MFVNRDRQARRRRAAATAAGVAAIALSLAPAGARAATFGSADFGTNYCTPGWTWVDPTAALPAGDVTAFYFRTGTLPYGGTDGHTLDFKVLRPIGGDQFTVVGSSGIKTLTSSSGSMQTFTLGTPITVQAGDVLGFWVDSNQAGAPVLPGCVGNNVGTGPVGNSGAAQANPGTGTTITRSFAHYNDLNVAAEVGAPTAVTGNGATTGAPANQFSISALAQGGTLNYTGASKTFDGDIQCVNVVGNSATIVAVDDATGRANRTMVQDNGGSGDKLVNTAFTPSAMTPRTRAASLTCVAPDQAKLGAATAPAGNSIQIGGSVDQ